MSETLRQLFSDSFQDPGGVLLAFVIYIFFAVLPVLGVLYLIYFLLTLPMRRNERARLFIDLLELGFKEGRNAEAALVDAAASKDRSLGVRFHLLATYLGEGMKLTQALEKVPRLLPAQLLAVLRAGERIGDIAKVLPACRMWLKDGVSQVRGALNYLVLLAFLATPFTIFVPLILKIKILPSYYAVFDGLTEGKPLPPFTRLVFSNNSVMLLIQTLVLLLVWAMALAYVGGPRLRRWLERLLRHEPVWLDWLLYRLPWRRKRWQRDFSAMLAVLLETGVPEAEALTLAGEATANDVFRQRARRGADSLGKGAKLAEVLETFDDTGELHWRLNNAFQRSGSFVRALAGWHEALDAKAFQLEQTAAQLATTLLVLLNGFVVSTIVIGMFLALIQLLNEATLW